MKTPVTATASIASRATLASIVSISMFAAGVFASGAATAAEFAIEEEDGAIAILIDGELFTRYVVGDEQSNMPYFYPVIGPGGKAVTRSFPMKEVEGEATDHPHQRSFYFAHQLINDFDTWHEELTMVARARGDAERLEELKKILGSIRHREILRQEAGEGRAVLEVVSDYIDASGEVAAEERRTFTFQVDDKGSRIVDFDIAIVASKGPVTLHDAKDAGLSLRVAQTISADAGEGGAIVNSEGDRDRETWGKRAAWVDFNGPVDGERVGIAMLNHPSSFRHPTPWHVRTYGLFTANPFGLKTVAEIDEDGGIELAPGESLTLRHRIIFHLGDEKDADIAGAWETYAAED